jgi:hypothetical protein
MYITEPVLAIGYPNYYEIPGFSDYAIAPNGALIKKATGEFVKPSPNPDGYINYRIMGDDGQRFTWNRHRLMAVVFKHPGVDITELVVNHENGIKGDDFLDNLEWMTQQENVEHAGMMGLTEKCLPISVRDYLSGEVAKYPSIIECARALGMSKDFINWRIKAGETRVFPEGKQYRLGHSDEPWFVPDPSDDATLRYGLSKAVDVRDVITGEIVTYPQMTDLAEDLGIALSTLSQWMDKPNQPVFPGFIQIKLVSDKTPWRIVEDRYLELERNTGWRSVVVTNAESGEEKIFVSARHCANAMGIKPTALDYRLKSRGESVFRDGFRYAYYADTVDLNK